MLDKNTAVLVTGARGMVGSAVLRYLKQHQFRNVPSPARIELDLENLEQYFSKNRPKYVFMIASKVGTRHRLNHLAPISRWDSTNADVQRLFAITALPN